MEYYVTLKSPFASAEVILQLSGAAPAGLMGFGSIWSRYSFSPYNSQMSLSPAFMGLSQSFSMTLPPVYENAYYTLHLMSAKGGQDNDYYIINSRTLVYDRRNKWAYWEKTIQTDKLEVTAAQLKAICPPASMTDINKHVKYLNDTMDKYQINTRLRQVHFLSQLAHESAHFARTLEMASGKAYEGRTGLKNTELGDGPRFKGRGLIQLTGRDVYTQYGRYIGRDLTEGDNMKVVEQEPYASDCAGWFWLKYKSYAQLNAKADRDDFEAVTRAINGGTNGIAERRSFYNNAKRIFNL